MKLIFSLLVLLSLAQLVVLTVPMITKDDQKIEQEQLTPAVDCTVDCEAVTLETHTEQALKPVTDAPLHSNAPPITLGIEDSRVIRFSRAERIVVSELPRTELANPSSGRPTDPADVFRICRLNC